MLRKLLIRFGILEGDRDSLGRLLPKDAPDLANKLKRQFDARIVDAVVAAADRVGKEGFYILEASPGTAPIDILPVDTPLPEGTRDEWHATIAHLRHQVSAAKIPEDRLAAKRKLAEYVGGVVTLRVDPGQISIEEVQRCLMTVSELVGGSIGVTTARSGAPGAGAH